MVMSIIEEAAMNYYLLCLLNKDRFFFVGVPKISDAPFGRPQSLVEDSDSTETESADIAGRRGGNGMRGVELVS